LFSFTIRRRSLATASISILAAVLLAILATLNFRDTHISAQDFPAVIGRIEGDDLEVVTATPTGSETDAAPTVVASGSEVTLRSGHALILLNAGGEISVCGPAHFKVLKSAGSVTLALDYGRVHPALDTSDGFQIYTPTIVATPIPISGGRRDLTLGLEQSGEMCVLTARGAMRVEPQFSDQSLIIPQGGTASLLGGQIESLQADASACGCEYPRARTEPQQPLPTPHSQPARDIGALAPPLPPQTGKTRDVPPPSGSESEPVYTVLMPPLSFNAGSPEPPPAPAPETILLVREVRLRPTVEFRGRVNPAPAPAIPATAQAAAPPAPPVQAPSASAPSKSQPGFLDRVRSFFHRLASTSKNPCAGMGCDG
jgi:hypothetical protein